MRSTLPVLAMLLGVLSGFMNAVVLGQTAHSHDGDLALVGGTIYASPTAEPIRGRRGAHSKWKDSGGG